MILSRKKLLFNIILPFSTTQAYSTKVYITSIKHMMQNDNSKNNRMNHKCPRLFTNTVSNAKDKHKSCIASAVNNKTGSGYHFESCILY